MIEENIRNPPQQEIILISCRGNQQCTYDISHINSIKVRLEHSTDCAHHKRQANFNSIKVRLELKSDKHLAEVFVFQFHKGAIRTVLLDPFLVLVLDFNSIKVRLELLVAKPLPFPIIYFNSIKVRLEQRVDVPCASQFHHFNSIKVRLELWNRSQNDCN